MRFKLTILVLALAALNISCSKKDSSVEDDWPGIDKIALDKKTEGLQALDFAGPLTLSSKLAIPSMGKDVSFHLTTSCHRELPTGSSKKRTYEKKLHHEAGAPVIAHLTTAEFLPPEVLIFPEFFNKCDISLTATNGIGSTQTSELKALDFKFDRSHRHLIGMKNSFQLNNKLPINKDDLKDISFQHHKPDLSFTNSSFKCFFGNNLTVKTYSAIGDQHSLVGAAILDKVSFNKKSALTTCIIVAKDGTGSTISSQRFRILDPFSKTYEFNLIENTFDDINPYTQLFYQNSAMNNHHAILSVQVKSSKNRNLSFNFVRKSSYENPMLAITGIEQVSREVKFGDEQFTYSPIYQKSRYSLEWIDRDTYEGVQKTYEVKNSSYKHFNLNLDLSLDCSSPNLNHSAELGLEIELMKSNPIFDFEVFETNEFTTDLVASFNIFDKKSEFSLISNMHKSTKPEDIKDFEDENSNLFLKLMFRNNQIQPNEQLKLSHIKRAFTPTDDSATFQTPNLTPPKPYPFSRYNASFAAQTTCSPINR